MKRFIKRKVFFVLFFLLFISLPSFSQSSAENSGGNVTFEKSDRSKIAYSGFAVEYVIPKYDASNSSYVFTSKGLAVNYEAYSPLSAKTALSANVSAVFLDQVGNLEFNLGLYIIAFKGFYIKPQLGVGQYNFSDKNLKDYIKTYNFTYRGQIGYLFKVNGAEGKRDKFIDLGVALHNISNKDLKINYWGLSAKFLFGPKPGGK